MIYVNYGVVEITISVDACSKEGIIENLKAVWNEHSDDEWGEFEKEEVCRYICGKIASGTANFLTEKTRDRTRTLYRIIAERIRQYQNRTPME